MGRTFGLQLCDVGGGQLWAALAAGWVPLIPTGADSTWKPGPFISAHPQLASAWVLETILARESDKTHIRRIHYSTSPEWEVLG